MNKLVLSLVFAFALTIPLGYATPAFALTLTQISTNFNNPIGIDHHSPTNSLVMSVYYSTGQPYNFERVQADGTHVQFSTASGFTDEVKIATVRPGNVGGFTAGDLFTGNGVDGQISRISNNGGTITSSWADLPGAGNGLMRGSLYVDRTGVFGGDLIVVTTAGQVWRVDNTGTATTATPLASTGVHLEGVITVPNNVAKYGPLAGKIIAGAEGQNRLYTVDPSGNTVFYTLTVPIEDIDLIPANENFYGVNFGTGKLLGAPASEFAGMAGDILLTSEFGGASTGLYRLTWDGANLVTTELPLDPLSFNPGQWEHVTFSPAGVVEIPPTEQVVGGELLPINNVALVIAGFSSVPMWMAPLIAGAVGVVAIYIKKLKN